jgi:hypothetical protein
MATNNLIDSVEGALQKLLIANLPVNTNVYTGKASSNKKAPCVICACDGEQEEDPPRTGNFWISVEVSVKSIAATEPGATVDPLSSDQAFVKSVFDIVCVNVIDALLSAQGFDLTILPQGFIFGSFKSGRDEQGVYVDQLPIRLYCCASILAP